MVIVRNKIIRLKQFKLIVQMFVFIREYKNRIPVLIVCLQYISKKLVGFIEINFRVCIFIYFFQKSLFAVLS